MSLDKALLKNILTLTFDTNMHFLKEQFPHLFEKFVNYEPKEYGLELDENNHLNIACNGHFIYAGNPKETVIEQTQCFIKNPIRNIYRITPMSDEEKERNNPIGFKHLDYLTDVARLGAKYEGKALFEDLHTIPIGRFPFLAVIGVGLGYHLEQLAEQNIDHIYIYEPNEDLFYSSLFTLNWRWLVERFQGVNKSITILVGANKESFFEGFQKLFFRFGIFKSGCLSFYKHYESETSGEIVDYILKNGRVLYSGFGFTEDEILSLKHTYENIAKQHAFLKAGTQLMANKIDAPIFICGSGPSLDDDFEIIKENKDKAIIVSCGSSLMALKKYGIKPDIHFEVERTGPVLDWLLAIDDKEYLSDITFIGMNTVYPPVMDLFKETILFLKPNDAASDMVRVTYEHDLSIIYATNPTVVNGALGFFNHVKSNDIYMFGCDFGYIDPNKHHSDKTGYFDAFKETAVVQTQKDQREANFGGVVYTDSTLDSARHAAEYTLRHHVSENDNKTVYNCSNGVKVVGTTALHSNEIVLEKQVDKAEFVQFLKSNSSDSSLDKETWQREIALRIGTIINIIDETMIKPEYLEIDFEPKDIIDIFDTVHQRLMSLDGTKDIVAIRVLNGSVTYMETTVLGYVYLIGNNTYCKSFLKEAFAVMFEYYGVLRTLLLEAAQEMGAKMDD
ncbi:hypothetical protein PULV_a1225 [Pseudoalteromonas ulvae UL12]|uniref:DUF115 domain-containing protein n=1 Tax=Pseudoalteromonas ulvae TaxID=107327 RepID=A0A244CSJ3_PSEDV|nr:6-hydroxymethylpterin diphosphokinase MptE-like protein [Pseudoalteromonas ulvae]MBE0363738.1 hypothetical protein [Pseudoalteromonas ulvae UL12]OUL58582.1 hypothetical protein B1199_09690 [Pseudoalteromonas ulvae]